MIPLQIFHGIIQSLLIVFSCLGVVDVNVPWKRGIIFSLIIGPIVILIRQIYTLFPVPFGVHSLILIFLLAVMFKIIIPKTTVIQALLASLIALIISLVMDAIFIINILRFLNVSMLQVLVDPVLYSGICFLGNLGYIFLFIANKIGFTIKI